MEDLIRRADAIKAEADRVYKVLHPAGCKESYEDCLKDAVKTFKDIPSAELKQGGWIETSEGTMCGNCHKFPYDDGEYHIANWHSDFCPNCGARMKGAVDDSSEV